MSLKKQYLKTKPICKVTFRLPKSDAPDARNAFLAGDFNDWHPERTPMKHLKKGGFTVTVSLETGTEYQYRYVVDDARWITDTQADKLVHCHYAECDNSVVVV